MESQRSKRTFSTFFIWWMQFFSNFNVQLTDWSHKQTQSLTHRPTLTHVSATRVLSLSLALSSFLDHIFFFIHIFGYVFGRCMIFLYVTKSFRCACVRIEERVRVHCTCFYSFCFHNILLDLDSQFSTFVCAMFCSLGPFELKIFWNHFFGARSVYEYIAYSFQ